MRVKLGINKPHLHHNREAKIETTNSQDLANPWQWPTRVNEEICKSAPREPWSKQATVRWVVLQYGIFASVVPWTYYHRGSSENTCSYESSWWTDGVDTKFVYPSLSWDPPACQPAQHACAHAQKKYATHTYTHARTHTQCPSFLVCLLLLRPSFTLRHKDNSLNFF